MRALGAILDPFGLGLAFLVSDAVHDPVFSRSKARAAAQAKRCALRRRWPVVAIRTCHDPYAQCEALLISVFMNLLNAHSQRAPVDGTVIKAEYFRGAFLNAALDKASSANERN